MITKEQLTQWVSAVADPDSVQPYQNDFWTLTDAELQALAEKAAAHGAAQRDAELLAAADKKPVPDGKSNWDWTSIDHYNDGWNAKRDFDAARLQGERVNQELLKEQAQLGMIDGLRMASAIVELYGMKGDVIHKHIDESIKSIEKKMGITGEEV